MPQIKKKFVQYRDKVEAKIKSTFDFDIDLMMEKLESSPDSKWLWIHSRDKEIVGALGYHFDVSYRPKRRFIIAHFSFGVER